VDQGVLGVERIIDRRLSLIRRGNRQGSYIHHVSVWRPKDCDEAA
jgi:hypothetical protein